jgi:predicted phage tail protein
VWYEVRWSNDGGATWWSSWDDDFGWRSDWDWVYSSGIGTGFRNIILIDPDGVKTGNYIFEVRAVNDVGHSLEAARSATITITADGRPSRPRDFRVLQSGIAFWTAPVYDGGSPITGYKIRYNHDDFGWSAWFDADTNFHDFGDFEPGEYVFEVIAINDMGKESFAASTALIVDPPGTPRAPSEPRNFAAMQDGTNVLFAWDGPFDLGYPLLGSGFRYEMRHQLAGDDWSDWSSEGIVSQVGILFDLEPGFYTFELRAANDNGESDVVRILLFEVLP